MSQSKTTCPNCQRPPGGVHPSGCPRSVNRLAALDADMAIGRPRLVWKKGFITYKKPRKWFSGYDLAQAFNPGVPRVVRGSNPRAGGIPRGKADQATEFLRAVGIEKAP